MTAALCTSPLDVLKTRLQSDFYKSRTAAADVGAVRSTSLLHLSFLNFRDTFQILFSIPRVEGWRALFKGLGPTLTGVVPASAIKFYAYGTSKSIISKSMNEGQEAAWVHLLAAAAAGLVVSTATNPIWLIKTRLQLDKSRAEEGVMAAKRYKNSLDCTLQVIRQEGIRGLYRGLSASYLGVTESTLQWILYEQMKMRLARQEERERGTGKLKTHWEGTKHWAWKIGAAGSAKLFAAGITYPHEVRRLFCKASSWLIQILQVVRTRLRQAPVGNERHKYTGLFQCFRLIWKEEGAAAMYGGMTAHLIRVVPSTAIMFGMYEVVLQFLGAQS